MTNNSIMTRETISSILRRRLEFDNAGVAIVILSTGTSHMARDFIKDMNFPGKVGIDHKGKVRDVLNGATGRSALQIFNLF